MASKKISELISSSLPPLSGTTTVVYSGVTHQSSLRTLRQQLVDSGSHVFTGSQTINGDLIISGTLTAQQYILSSSISNITTETISGSSNFGNSLDDTHKFTGSLYLTNYLNVSGSGSFDTLHVGVGDIDLTGDANQRTTVQVNSSGSINNIDILGNHDYYTQINLKNTNSGPLASGDIVVTADNGTEGVHYVDLGINSSTYNGGVVGYANDAYLLNVGKDLYLGTIGGTSHPAKLFLFANNTWNNPQVTVHTGSEVTFNTSSFTDGYTYEFSGSAKIVGSLYTNNLTGSLDWSHIINEPTLVSGSSQIQYSGLTGVPSGLVSGSQQIIDLGYATTGSNIFNGDQIISGTKYLAVETIQNLSGSINLITSGNSVEILGSNLYVQNGGIITNYNVSASAFTGSLDWANLINTPSLISGSSQITNLGFASTSSLLQITGSDNQIRIVNTNGTSSIQLPSGILAHSGSLHIGSSGALQFGSMLLGQSVTGFLSSVSDGNFRFGDSSGGSNMGRIILGSVSTSYPSIKREGAGIGIKTADDSAYSFISSSKFITSGGTSTQFVKGDGSLDSGNIVSGSSQIVGLGFAVTGSNTFVGDQTINGSLIIEGVSEVLTVDGGFTGNRDFDYTSASVFYLTGLTGNGAWNITNVPTTNNRGTTMTFVVNQDSTPYSASAYSINSSAVTVKWAESTVPTGSANKVDIIGLTAFRVGSDWNVIGSLSSFGS